MGGLVSGVESQRSRGERDHGVTVATESGSVELPGALRSWVEAEMGYPAVAAAPHFAGASRSAWRIDLDSAARPSALFLLQDKGEGGGSERDAAVLTALAHTSIPVPEVCAYDGAHGALLLTRLPGRSDFPAVDRASEREPTIRHLMQLAAELHALDVGSLSIPHLTPPAADQAREVCAGRTLEQMRGVLGSIRGSSDPFFDFAIGWLEAHAPTSLSRFALVHSDLGPGNFLFEDGRVTGIVDWEVAHYGDPMEDLAALAVRDMATPVGSLAQRYREYAAFAARAHGLGSAGAARDDCVELDLGRIDYYRAMLLTRNSLLISAGLAEPPAGFDVVEMTMYQTLLLRAAACVICDLLRVSRPSASGALVFGLDGSAEGAAAAAARTHVEAHGDTHRLLAARADGQRTAFAAALGRDLQAIEGRQTEPDTAPAERVLRRVERGLAYFEHESRVGPALDRAETSDLAALLGQPFFDVDEPESRLRALCARRPIDPLSPTTLARYFTRRFHRLAERRRPLMGALYERLPQPLFGPEVET